MANPITFKPAAIDPHLELERRLKAAPREHAEALLVAYDVLQAAHDQGLLDAAHGLISAKDTVFAKLAGYGRLPEGVSSIRNLTSALKIFSTLDPDSFDRLAKSLSSAASDHRQEKTPSLFRIFKRAASEDGRRGLSFLTLLLIGLGRSLKD